MKTNEVYNKGIKEQIMKEFDKKFPLLGTKNGKLIELQIKCFLSQAIDKAVKEAFEVTIPKGRKTIINMLREDNLFINHGIDGIKGYNQALSETKQLQNKFIKGI